MVGRLTLNHFPNAELLAGRAIAQFLLGPEGPTVRFDKIIEPLILQQAFRLWVMQEGEIQLRDHLPPKEKVAAFAEHFGARVLDSELFVNHDRNGIRLLNYRDVIQAGLEAINAGADPERAALACRSGLDRFPGQGLDEKKASPHRFTPAIISSIKDQIFVDVVHMQPLAQALEENPIRFGAIMIASGLRGFIDQKHHDRIHQFQEVFEREKATFEPLLKPAKSFLSETRLLDLFTQIFKFKLSKEMMVDNIGVSIDSLIDFCEANKVRNPEKTTIIDVLFEKLIPVLNEPETQRKIKNVKSLELIIPLLNIAGSFIPFLIETLKPLITIGIEEGLSSKIKSLREADYPEGSTIDQQVAFDIAREAEIRAYMGAKEITKELAPILALSLARLIKNRPEHVKDIKEIMRVITTHPINDKAAAQMRSAALNLTKGFLEDYKKDPTAKQMLVEGMINAYKNQDAKK